VRRRRVGAGGSVGAVAVAAASLGAVERGWAQMGVISVASMRICRTIAAG